MGKIKDSIKKITPFVKPYKIGFLTEERSLLTKLTVYEQIIYYGVLKSMTEEEIDKKIDYWLDRFGIIDYKNKKIKELSKGNQQKVQFVTAMLHNPDLIVLLMNQNYLY